MKIGDAINKILDDMRWTKTHFAHQMGYVRSSAFTTLFSKNNIELNTLCRMADVLGYEVVLQKKRQGRRAEDQIVLEAGEK